MTAIRVVIAVSRASASTTGFSTPAAGAGAAAGSTACACKWRPSVRGQLLGRVPFGNLAGAAITGGSVAKGFVDLRPQLVPVARRGQAAVHVFGPPEVWDAKQRGKPGSQCDAKGGVSADATERELRGTRPVTHGSGSSFTRDCSWT